MFRMSMIPEYWITQLNWDNPSNVFTDYSLNKDIDSDLKSIQIVMN